MAISVLYNTSDESSHPYVMLDEETYKAIESYANRFNISPEEAVALAIEYLRSEQARTDKLEKQLIEILAR